MRIDEGEGEKFLRWAMASALPSAELEGRRTQVLSADPLLV